MNTNIITVDECLILHEFRKSVIINDGEVIGFWTEPNETLEYIPVISKVRQRNPSNIRIKEVWHEILQCLSALWLQS